MKISPIAKYLTENKAITIKEGNIKRFVSPEGMYLGHMTMDEQNGASIYSIEIFSGLKKMFYQAIAIGQKFAYVTDKQAKLGVSLVPAETYVFKVFLDFINNKFHEKHTLRMLQNDLDLIEIDDSTGIGLHYAERPFIYRESVLYENHKDLSNNFIKYDFKTN